MQAFDTGAPNIKPFFDGFTLKAILSGFLTGTNIAVTGKADKRSFESSVVTVMPTQQELDTNVNSKGTQLGDMLSHYYDNMNTVRNNVADVANDVKNGIDDVFKGSKWLGIGLVAAAVLLLIGFLKR